MGTRLGEFQRVLVTRGKKLLEFEPGKDRDEILDLAIGRSGNLRAPSLSHQGLLVVGFNSDAYRELI